MKIRFNNGELSGKMMGKKDYILIVVLYGSLLCSIIFHEFSAELSGSIKYLLMGLLFLSFIKISPTDVVTALRLHWAEMIWGTLLRLVVAPAAAYWFTLALFPPLAIPILLLAGTSTAVSSPFFTSLCRGNIPYSLVMAIATSLFLPLTLPTMVTVMTQTTLNFDLTAMAAFLFTVTFVPLGGAFLFQTLTPKLVESMNQVSYPVSLFIVAGINFGALGRYVPYLQMNPELIFKCGQYSIVLALFLAFTGWYSTRITTWEHRVAASGSQIWVNNILIVALAVHMNEPLTAILSAFYLLPFYGFVVLFSILAKRVDSGYQSHDYY